MRRLLVVSLVASVLAGVASAPASSSVIHTMSHEDDEQIAVTASASADESIAADEAVGTIASHNTAGIVVTPTSVNVTEGGATGTYTVVLESRPTRSVTITPTVVGSDVTVSPASRRFRRGNWDTPQSFTIRAVDDDVDETSPEVNLVTHVATSGDAAYAGISVASVTANVIDDDATPGVTVSGSPVSVTEGGTTDTYTVVLDSQPTSNVTISRTVVGSDVTVSPASRTFTTANWNITQSFTVTAVDDSIAEGPHGDTISLASSSADPDYQAVGVPSVTVDITDDDTLGVTVSGPSVGVPGVVASFGVTINSSAAAASFAWRAVRTGIVVATGTAQDFAFTPALGGTFFVGVEVLDNNGASVAVAVLLTVLGDVGESSFASDVIWMASEGITRGCNPPDNDEFCPNDAVSRGQMAAFLVRALGLTDRGTVDFVDDDESIFQADIERLAAAGITRGCNPPDNDRFCPDSKVTRGAMAAFLVRALSLTDDGGGNLFIDDNGSIFEADIDKLGTAGVTRGCNPPDNDRFCPDSPVTRGQMAAFLRRALG